MPAYDRDVYLNSITGSYQLARDLTHVKRVLFFMKYELNEYSLPFIPWHVYLLQTIPRIQTRRKKTKSVYSL